MSAQKTKDIQQATCFLGTTDAASKTHTETFLESVYPKADTVIWKTFHPRFNLPAKVSREAEIFSVFTRERHS